MFNEKTNTQHNRRIQQDCFNDKIPERNPQSLSPQRNGENYEESKEQQFQGGANLQKFSKNNLPKKSGANYSLALTV